MDGERIGSWVGKGVGWGWVQGCEGGGTLCYGVLAVTRFGDVTQDAVTGGTFVYVCVRNVCFAVTGSYLFVYVCVCVRTVCLLDWCQQVGYLVSILW